MMKFKKGNGVYAKCTVFLCPFWSGRSEEIYNHLRKVHLVPDKEAHRITMKFLDYCIQNG